MDNVKAKLRLVHIPRWGIVPMLRHQSVAEHSYNVWLLAMDLYDTIYPVPHNSDERAAVSNWALCHDLCEVYSGDIPNTFKKNLEAVAPGAFARAEQEAMEGEMGSVVSLERGVRNTSAYLIVKIADKVEEIKFFNDYASGEARKMGVESKAWTRLGQAVGDLQKALVASIPTISSTLETWLSSVLEVPVTVHRPQATTDAEPSTNSEGT